jgi:hypothetical protein
MFLTHTREFVKNITGGLRNADSHVAADVIAELAIEEPVSGGFGDDGVVGQAVNSKNTSSISSPLVLANALAEPTRSNPHFSRTRIEAALSLAALA